MDFLNDIVFHQQLGLFIYHQLILSKMHVII